MRDMWTRILVAGCALITATPLCAQQLSTGTPEQSSTGEPHKWEVVGNKSMYDFVSEGFELKAVAYDASALGPHTDSPDVHYFLQKNTDLVRCDFHKRDETSYYWCYKLGKAK